MKLLLIEDHREIAGVICDFFELKGHEVDYASDGKFGLELARTQHYSLIILDIMLPEMDGITVCKTLREEGVDIPILMLTARDSNQDVLDGFDTGADDYLVKPFDLNILEARINALVRRYTGDAAKTELKFGSLTLDLSSRELKRETCTFKLNQTQFVIMKLLMLRAPKIVTREELIQEIWQGDEPERDVLRSHFYQLRSQIDKPFSHAYVKTVPKVGYHLQKDDKA